MRRITMRDIAQNLGVSTNTVSRALSNKPDIRNQTRRRVLDAAKKMGYEYSRGSNGSRTQQSKTVGLVVADNSNLFFSRVIKGAEDAMSNNGYHLILCNTDEKYDKERDAIDLLTDRKVDGILITPTQSSREDIAKLKDEGVIL